MNLESDPWLFEHDTNRIIKRMNWDIETQMMEGTEHQNHSLKSILFLDQ